MARFTKPPERRIKAILHWGHPEALEYTCIMGCIHQAQQRGVSFTEHPLPQSLPCTHPQLLFINYTPGKGVQIRLTGSPAIPHLKIEAAQSTHQYGTKCTHITLTQNSICTGWWWFLYSPIYPENTINFNRIPLAFIPNVWAVLPLYVGTGTQGFGGLLRFKRVSHMTLANSLNCLHLHSGLLRDVKWKKSTLPTQRMNTELGVAVYTYNTQDAEAEGSQIQSQPVLKQPKK